MRIYGSPQNALVIPYNARNLPHSTLYGRIRTLSFMAYIFILSENLLLTKYLKNDILAIDTRNVTAKQA